MPCTVGELAMTLQRSASLLASLLLLGAALAIAARASHAGQILATLTAAEPIIFIGTPGVMVRVPAESISFFAQGDTRLVRFVGNEAVFDAPIRVTIPGVLTHESTRTGSSVKAGPVGNFSFVVNSAGPFSETVYAFHGSMAGYKFGSSREAMTVNASTYATIGGGHLVYFDLDDGRTLAVDLNNSTSTLEVVVNGEVTTITHLPRQADSTRPIAIRIDDFTVMPVGFHWVRVEGATIRIHGESWAFDVERNAKPYSVTLSVPPLPPGDYTVEYHRAEYVSQPTAPVLRATATLRVEDPAGLPPPPLASPVFEYFHEGFGHYFITADEDEQLAIETGRFFGWQRVGPLASARPQDGFAFHRSPAAGRVALCRFFSVAFAPKSTHFYTSNAAECELVKRNLDWTFEGIAGYVLQPRSDGTCAEGVPLYRLYNNGRSGAPNHRFTTDEHTRGSMVGLLWASEGIGSQGVTACVPLRPSAVS
jgi:hypothetical protein